MHYGLSSVRQDSFAIGSSSGNDCQWVIAAIADGVSSSAQSHTFADYMARQAVILISDELPLIPNGALNNHDFWADIATRLVGISDEFCRIAAKRIVSEEKSEEVDKALPRDFVRKWATTLEFVIIQASFKNPGADAEFVHVTVAGDGAAFVLNEEQGWNTVRMGKRRSGAIVSNAVLSLPLIPEEFSVNFGFLRKNDCFILTTDGLGDFIGDGSSPLGGFFQANLPKCESLASFLQIVDVSLYQADDDRTIIMIKRNG